MLEQNMPIDTSLNAINSNTFGYKEAGHLLNRAGFGGTPKQISTLVSIGLKRSVDILVNYESKPESFFDEDTIDKDLIRPPTQEEKEAYRAAKEAEDETAIGEFRRKRNKLKNQDRQQMLKLGIKWLERMISTSSPLEEKMMILWHGHFASNYRTVRDSYHLYMQHQTIRKNATGNFGDMVYDIVKDPAMIRFLDNNSNVKGKPNENLARELMELFTLGEGNYTEKDIKEGARALTGHTFNDDGFQFNKRRHDYGKKKILGNSGKHNAKDFVRIILSKRTCTQFVAYKLYKHFINDIEAHPSITQQKVIDRIAYFIRRHNYNIKPVLVEIFKSRHFYDKSNIAHKIKSPTQLIVGTIRKLNAPPRDITVLADALDIMGQKLFEPPSVKGWDGGKSWINTATLFTRHNITAYIASGKLPNNRSWRFSDVGFDVMSLTQSTEPKLASKDLVDRLLGKNQSPDVYKTVEALFDKRQGKVDQKTVLAATLLIMTLPQYQLV